MQGGKQGRLWIAIAILVHAGVTLYVGVQGAGRFSAASQLDGGVIRLDTRTGELAALAGSPGTSHAIRALARERAALKAAGFSEQEIDDHMRRRMNELVVIAR